MIGPKLERFLEQQKARMIKHDRDEGFDRDPSSPKIWDNQRGAAVPGMQMIYDNVLNWLKTSGAGSLGDEFAMLEQTLSEDSLSTGAPTFTTFMLPLVRRMFHNMVALDLVSTQPIPNPSAYIYWLNKTFTHTDATSGITAGQRLDQQTPRNYVRSPGEATTPIREIQMSLTRLLIEAETDKLKADFT